MLFSDHYEIERQAEDDWFDPVMTADTRLFIDPFRIYADSDEPWQTAHADLIEFFNMTLQLVARAGSTSSATWRAAERLFTFPEPPEFCLGYGITPFGAGTGEWFAAEMLEGARVAIDANITELRHFEEITLFADGIGPDRISDIVCNVLKSYFVAYTQEIAERHGIELLDVPVRHASWSRELEVWQDEVERLPRNPFTNKGVLLVPERFLRPLPTLTPEEFWDWSWQYHSEEIRGQFNYDIGKNVDGAVIAAFARANPALADRYVESAEETGPKPAYDLTTDPDSEYQWYNAGLQLADRASVPDLPDEAKAFCEWVRTLLEGFTHNIEEQDGWMLLWVGSKSRSERYAQALLRTAVWQVCRDHDVDFSGEPNAGRGPADFKFSQGWVRRAITEVKLTNNTQFWHGLESQTPQYMKSEGIQCGFFLSVGFRDQDFEDERMERVRKAAKRVSDETGYSIRVVFVDARPKESASKAGRSGTKPS